MIQSPEKLLRLILWMKTSLLENLEVFLKSNSNLPMPGMIWNLSLTSGSTAAVTIFTLGYA